MKAVRASDRVEARGVGAVLVRRPHVLSLRLSILDRYMITELGGPFAFGLSAFTLIFAATQILAISRLVSDQHAALWAVIEYFVWQLPGIVVLVIPMAMLLGVLLTMGTLSGNSEITAMKAGGISLVRIAAPLLATGFVVSVLALMLQEGVVPYANDRATYLRQETIEHVGVFSSGNLAVVSKLPSGGRQLTTSTGYEPASQTLLNVVLIQYDTANHPVLIVFADRARYVQPTWAFRNVTEYHFESDGTTWTQTAPQQQWDIGQKPSQIMQRAAGNNPENMSRAQIRDLISSGQLSPAELRTYLTSYQEKLARPFATFVFTLIAVPFGLNSPRRGGGGAGLGFGLAVAIVFVYFVIASVTSAVFTSIGGGPIAAAFGAWLPNALFTAIGALFVRRASFT
ncbi:MAG: LptF/LptG family permease [Candidatus Eremiobacteraeota bacterium]|nr:LptF/LptG family permease [Candidatus Eremiobacteraeota bacterium]